METTNWVAIPPSFECNPYVVNGYRPVGRPLFGYLASAFSWHNETINAWTMIVGFFIFVDALERSTSSSLSLSAFAACAACMFAASASFHIFWPKGKTWYTLLSRLDYGCIVACVGAYGIPVSDIVFGNNAVLANLCRAVTTAATLLGIREVASIKMSATRRLLVCGRTAWFVPLLFARALFGNEADESVEISRRLLVVGMLYPTGAVLYATRIPERIRPGKFDYFGSHEIMHACVLVAVVCHLKILELSVYNRSD